MRIKAGTLADFSGSMAEAMEQALQREWAALKGWPLPELGQAERRVILSSIAQGVVRHLKERAGDTFKVDVDTTQVNGGPGGPLIVSNNPAVISSSWGGGAFDIGRVVVQQVSDPANLIKTQGAGKVSILTNEDP